MNEDIAKVVQDAVSSGAVALSRGINAMIEMMHVTAFDGIFDYMIHADRADGGTTGKWDSLIFKDFEQLNAEIAKQSDAMLNVMKAMGPDDGRDVFAVKMGIARAKLREIGYQAAVSYWGQLYD